MWLRIGLWQAMPLLLAVAAGMLYTRGWRRLRYWLPELAQPRRLGYCWAGILLISAAHLPPLYNLSAEFLAARSILKR